MKNIEENIEKILKMLVIFGQILFKTLCFSKILY